MHLLSIGWIGLLIFALSQGVRDALFGNVFQSVSFFLVAVLTFGVSTILFCSVVAATRPSDFRKLASYPIKFIALNVTTALPWLSFFYGLTHLEPAVVATLYNGIGPITVLVLAALKYTDKAAHSSTAELLCYLGIAVVLAALAFITLTDRSGMSDTHFETQVVALVVVSLGGIMITVSHMIARQFNDCGVGSNAVMGTRFLATLAIAIIAMMAFNETTEMPSPFELLTLTLMAFVLITVPISMLQLGVAGASPLAVNAMRALGPVSVFAVQQFDGRLQFSGATLVCVVGFCLFALAARAFKAWAEMRPAETPA